VRYFGLVLGELPAASVSSPWCAWPWIAGALGRRRTSQIGPVEPRRPRTWSRTIYRCMPAHRLRSAAHQRSVALRQQCCISATVAGTACRRSATPAGSRCAGERTTEHRTRHPWELSTLLPLCNTRERTAKSTLCIALTASRPRTSVSQSVLCGARPSRAWTRDVRAPQARRMGDVCPGEGQPGWRALCDGLAGRPIGLGHGHRSR
jgi:hypothetical protein